MTKDLDPRVLALMDQYLKQWEYDRQTYGLEVVESFHMYYTQLFHLNRRLQMCQAVAPYWIAYLVVMPCEYN